MSAVPLDSGLSEMSNVSNVDPTTGDAAHVPILYIQVVFDRPKNLEIFFSGRPTGLCTESILLMWLKGVLTQGRRVTKVGPLWMERSSQMY
jgi:hypothetical protein